MFTSSIILPEMKDQSDCTQVSIDTRKIFMDKCNVSAAYTDEVFAYYSGLFVLGKLKDNKMSNYREDLSKFVSGTVTGMTHRNYTSVTIYDESGPVTLAEQSIVSEWTGLALYLLWQYQIDILIEQNMTMTVQQMKDKFECIAPKNQYAQFAMSPDISDPARRNLFTVTEIVPDADRVMTLHGLYAYTHKHDTIFICKSQNGPVKITLRRTDPFIRYTHDLLMSVKGMDIEIGAGRVYTNISGDSAMYTIGKWAFATAHNKDKYKL